MKYIQSFYQYPVTFSAIGKTIPARSAQGEMKNIAEVTEKELEKLQNSEPFFRELVSKKKVRVLNHIPTSYVPPAQRINEATAEADKFKTENEKLRARFAELEAKTKDSVKESEEPSTETPEGTVDDSKSEAETPADEPKKQTSKKTNKK